MQDLSPEDRAFFERRVEAEFDAAQSATDPCAVKIHYDLANLYLEKIYGGADDRPALPALRTVRSTNWRGTIVKKPVSR